MHTQNTYTYTHEYSYTSCETNIVRFDNLCFGLRFNTRNNNSNNGFYYFGRYIFCASVSLRKYVMYVHARSYMYKLCLCAYE